MVIGWGIDMVIWLLEVSFYSCSATLVSVGELTVSLARV